MSTLLTTAQYIANSGDNTSFRTYGNAISQAFANAGWTQTSDSGQANWSTVIANGTANATQTVAYELWKMNDALANLVPCIVKIEYRTTVNTNSPTLFLQLGSGSDGAGTLTGTISPNVAVRSTPGANAWTWYIRGDSDSITLGLWSNASATPSGFCIERTKDANGNNTANGIHMCAWGVSSAGLGLVGLQMYWHPSMGSPGLESSLGIFTQVAAQLNGNGTTAWLYPLYNSRGIFMNPMFNVLMAPTGLITPNSPFTFPFYATNRTFLPLPGSNTGYTVRSSALPTNFHVCMRWE